MAKKIMFNDRYGLTEAVLSGRKTMTRRIIKSKNIIARHWNPAFNADHCYYTDGIGKCQLIDTDTNKIIIPQFKVGEVVAIATSYKDVVEHLAKKLYDVGKWMDDNHITKNMAGWLNKMFVKADLMIFHIRITDIKVERLQDISDEDCIKEGIIHAWTGSDGVKIYHSPHGKKGYLSTDKPRDAFAFLIDRISGKCTFKSNPYVFAYSFVLIN